MANEITITERDRRIAAAVLKGDKPIYEILIAEGVRPSTATKGQAALTKGIRLAMLQMRGRHYATVGKELLSDPQQIEQHVTGFLYESTLDRNSKGVAAAKLLGQHKRVDMFTGDAQQNVLVIAAPADWKPKVHERDGVAREKTIDVPAALPPAEDDLPEYE